MQLSIFCRFQPGVADAVLTAALARPWCWVGKVQSGFCCPVYHCLFLKLKIFENHLSALLQSGYVGVCYLKMLNIYACPWCHGLCLYLVCWLRKCSWSTTLIFRNIDSKYGTIKTALCLWCFSQETVSNKHWNSALYTSFLIYWASVTTK